MDSNTLKQKRGGPALPGAKAVKIVLTEDLTAKLDVTARAMTLSRNAVVRLALADFLRQREGEAA